MPLRFSRHLTIAVALCLLAHAGACRGLDERDPPDILVSPLSIGFSPTNIGSEATRSVTVRNNGESTLRVSRIEPAVSSDHISVDFDGPRSLEPGEEFVFAVLYAPTSTEETTGVVNVFSNDPTDNPAQVAVDRIRPSPILQVVPNPMTFGTIAVDSQSVLDTSIVNVGTAPLIICSASVEIGGQFSTDILDRIEADDRRAGEFLALPPATETDQEEATLAFGVTFAPTRLGAAQGTLAIRYDTVGDTDNACEEGNLNTTEVQLVGNGATSELSLDPCSPFIDFGEVPFAATSRRTITMRNDQELALQVFGARLVTALSDPAFRIGAAPDFPIGLDPGGERTFELTFSPVRLASEESRALAGVLEVEHTDIDGERVTTRCDISGVGVDRACPVAVGRAFILEDPQTRRSDEISWAVPLQTVVLDATDSFSPSGLGLDYEWEIVSQPNDAFAGLRPYTANPESDAFRQFFMPIAGEYIFALRVFDGDGFESCDEARVIVDATPDRTISVELTWRNPADPDETNDDGSDLDIHFLKVGPGRWFRAPYDVYFANQAPEWLPENPTLDIDVRNGLGPETVTMDNPQECQWYAIGAHYFREAWGTSIATIRVYVDGQLVHEQSPGVLQAQNDFWDVGRLHWPSGEFFEVNTIINNFDGANTDPVAPPTTDEIEALAAQNDCFQYP